MERLINGMQKTTDKINLFAGFMASLTFACMSVIVILQVISRSFLSYSFQWAEEMARYFFIWSTMLAATCATYSHVHIGVDILVSYLREKIKRTMEILAYLFFISALIVLLHYGGLQALQTAQSGQTATSFPVSAGLLFFSIPFNALLMLFICVTQLMELLFHGKNRDVGTTVDPQG